VVGLNFAFTVQLAPPASVVVPETQVPPVTRANSPASVPVSEMVIAPLTSLPVAFDTVKVKSPLLVPTRKLPNGCDVGAIDSTATASPVPVNVEVGVPPGVPVTESEAVLAPGVVGLNFAFTVQLAPPARVVVPETHVPPVTRANWPASVPVSEITIAPLTSAPAAFETVNVKSPLLVLTRKLPKACAVGEIDSAGVPSPVPVNDEVAVPPGVPVTDNEAVLPPDEVGLNFAVTVQLAPPTSVVAPETQVPPVTTN
jgi:hypothetical protein